MNSLEHVVYKKLQEVPVGKVTTYKDLANAVGLKNGQRLIGRIMNKNPNPIVVPCHRVVKSTGELGGYSRGSNIKKSLLTKEGIDFRKDKIVEFEKRIHRF